MSLLPEIRKKHFKVPIKNSFHTYKVDGLGIVGISDSMPAEISQLAEYSSFVSAQAEEHFWVFFNGKVQFKFECQSKIVSHFLFDYNVAVLLTDLPSIQDGMKKSKFFPILSSESKNLKSLIETFMFSIETENFLLFL